MTAPTTRDGADVGALEQRVEYLERALLLLASHCGGVGWNHELSSALGKVALAAPPAEGGEGA